ncbi:uncharacterized protein LMH87_007806 [Akanthomyces muscarius]|uniref:Uncharacterized protein n=1 Tax=Akanthomyces muscarius TaxID=2231603 RepID=A0A9W8UR09_AKAMU|nr:uncharacterized protein LMH87_007806 [Akanthomyces muscarius]KAJ4159868.1 hypothetical protein LMH87_007806 [Akanthomyces muscarius]
MSKTRRHALKPLTLVTLLRLASAAIPSHLRDDISAFIPACAEQCLVSFLTVNYARGDDTDRNLSLDFVCANRGRSGYTVGEGALQCLTGERNVGFCSAVESGDVAFSRAYQICSDKTAVAKPNGGTITATLRFGPQSGILTFAPITSSATPLPIPTATDTTIAATDTDTDTSSRSSSTLSFTETTLTTATATSSSSNTKASSSTSRTTTTSTATSTPTPTQDAPPSTRPLSKGQIAGISIGAVCIAAGVAFGLILLVRFLLRRRRRHSGSTIGSFVGGGGNGGGGGGGSYRPARDTWGYGFDKTSHSSGRSSWIAREAPGMSRYPAMPAPGGSGASGHAAQQQQQQQQQLPYNRDSWRPSAIGLAISPSKLSGGTPAATPTRLRPLSKLLPAKPDMPPVAPKNSSPPPAMRPAHQESHGNQAPQQSQAFLHPIAAQFMRPAAAPSPPQQPPAAAAAAAAANSQRPYSLRLVIPDDAKPPPAPPAQDKKLVQSRPQAGAGRDSTLTEFEEDELRRSTSPSAGQIWCPPSAGPDSAAAAAPYYVSDGCGNWVLGDAKSALEREMQSPLSAGTVPRVATARSGIVTTAVQTQIPARRSREPLAAAADEPKREQELPSSIQNTPEVLAATPLIRSDQTQEKGEEREAATADPKTPRVRSVVRTPKTVPSPLFSRQPNPRSVSTPLPNINTTTTASQGRSLTAGGRSRATSADSGVTTFSIGSDDAADDNNLKSPFATTPGPVNNLSPVAESPRSRATASNTGSNDVHATTIANTAGPSENTSGGVSPVSYPRIPGRGTSGPPPRGGRGHFPGVAPSRMLLFNQQDTGQPSPTLGRESFQRQPPHLPHGDAPAPDAAARYSRGGGNGVSRGRGRGGSMMMMMRPPAHNSTMGGAPAPRPPSQASYAQQQRTGSPTMRIVEPSPSPEPQHGPPYPTTTSTAPPPRDDRSMLPSAARQPRRRPPSHLPHPFPMYPQPRPGRAAAAPPQEPTIPNITTDRDSFSRYPGHPMPIPQPYQRHSQHQHELWRPPSQSYNPAAHDNSSQEALATASASSPSASSLLLAKRLGTQRAANMALQPPPKSQSNLGIRSRWQQSPQQQQTQTPQGGGGGGDGRTQGGYRAAEYPATQDLPSTPTWLPRLTPTRRGEDLVLNVG